MRFINWLDIFNGREGAPFGRYPVRRDRERMPGAGVMRRERCVSKMTALEEKAAPSRERVVGRGKTCSACRDVEAAPHQERGTRKRGKRRTVRETCTRR